MWGGEQKGGRGWISRNYTINFVLRMLILILYTKYFVIILINTKFKTERMKRYSVVFLEAENKKAGSRASLFWNRLSPWSRQEYFFLPVVLKIFSWKGSFQKNIFMILLAEGDSSPCCRNEILRPPCRGRFFALLAEGDSSPCLRREILRPACGGRFFALLTEGSEWQEGEIVV